MIGEEGPLLARLLEAQTEADRAVAFPAIKDFAAAVVKIIDELENPLVWPMDGVAERLAGAAVLLGGGRVCVRSQSSTVGVGPVLVLAGVAVSPLTIVDAAVQARRFGAPKVHAAAVRLDGAEDAVAGGFIDSYVRLSPVPSRRLALAAPA